MAKKERPTQARLKEVFDYDPTTGIFTRKKPAKYNPPTRKYGRIGDGRVSELGYVLLMLDGTNYIAGTLAWLYERGEWPHAKIRYLNGNRLDNRIVNIGVYDRDREDVKATKLTADRVKELLNYDPVTGFFTWKVGPSVGMRAGSTHGLGYRQMGIEYKKCLEHQVAWLYMTGEWPNGEIDHINGVKHDNRWANLRIVTRSQNGHNKPKGRGGATGFPGVGRHGRKYRATLTLDGDMRIFGWFDTIAEARIARLLGEKELFGLFTSWISERDGKIPSGDGFVTLEVRDGDLFVDGKRPWSTPQVEEIAA